MGSAEAAELAKLAETTYRDVNIALANEFARFADRTGIDIDRVIAAANSQPFSHIHRPGVAVGGHCIPVYPRFYLDADHEARLPGAAREVNAGDARATPSSCSRPSSATLAGARVRDPRRGLPRQRQGDRVQRRVRAARRPRRPRRRGARDRPALRRRRAARARVRAWDGREAAGAILQADHAELHAPSGPDDLPGVRAIVDGRGLLDGARFAAAGVALRRIGGG